VGVFAGLGGQGIFVLPGRDVILIGLAEGLAGSQIKTAGTDNRKRFM
jgi:hypothetical protein